MHLLWGRTILLFLLSFVRSVRRLHDPMRQLWGRHRLCLFTRSNLLRGLHGPETLAQMLEMSGLDRRSPVLSLVRCVHGLHASVPDM